MTTTLEKMKAEAKAPKLVKKIPVSQDLRTELRAFLSYTIGKDETPAMERPATLARVLNELNVSVFNPASVASYKLEKLQETRKANAARDKKSASWRRPRYLWRVHNLKDYTKPIPLNILKLALKIAKALPDALFKVEELSKSYTPVGDPFLTVIYGSARYYIAQWDEPTFSDES